VESLCAISEPATLARFARQASAGRGLATRDSLTDGEVEYIDLAIAGVPANVNTPDDPPRSDDRGTG